jgi:hypothetical protein
MEGLDVVYAVCLNRKNVRMLVDIIREDIRLNEKAIPKCITMIHDVMKRNIKKLSRPPKDKEELKKVVRYLNNMCVNIIIEAIVKKYPNLQISRKKQVGQEQMKRDLDIYGERDNYVSLRPFSKSKKEYDDDISYNLRPNDIGFQGSDNFCNYATAFDNHLITNVPIGKKQIFNNPHSDKDSSQLEKRYQDFVEQRNKEYGNHSRPPTPDFTLDGSGEKIRMEKMLRRLQEQQNVNHGNIGNMNGIMNGIPIGMDSLGMEDPYAALLAEGAPKQNTQINPYMGMGNPLMPISNISETSNQFGNLMNAIGPGPNNQSIKSMQLQMDYEKKLAERQMVDIETNQPITNNQVSQIQGGMMNGMGILSLPNSTYGLSCPANNAPTSNINFLVNNETMSNMNLPTNNAPTSNMNFPANNVTMPNMNFHTTNLPNLNQPNIYNMPFMMQTI